MSAANDIRTIIDGILKTPHPAATSAADLHLDDAIDEVAHALAELVDLARAEAAEAALATERAAIVAEMKAREAAAFGRSEAAQEEARDAGLADWDDAGLADWGAAEALRALAADIAAGAHVRPVEGA